MKPSRIPVVALALALFFAGVLRAETLDVATLKAGEEIEVKYATYGDRHLLRRLYSIRGGEKTTLLALELQSEVRQWKREMKGRTEIPIGGADLDAIEIRGLDTYLLFLRTRFESNCPTTDVLEVSYYRDGVKIGEESFKDRTCVATGVNRVAGRVVVQSVEYRDFPPELLRAMVTFTCIEERIIEELPDGLLSDGTKPSPARL